MSQITVVEHTGDLAPVAPALRELRPTYESDASLVDTLRQLTVSQGLRVFGAHVESERMAAAAITVRVQENLVKGRFLYVDDLVTRQDYRRRGLAHALFDRVTELAEESDCAGRVYLDSGLAPNRAAAHGFYFQRGLRIASFHFGP